MAVTQAKIDVLRDQINNIDIDIPAKSIDHTKNRIEQLDIKDIDEDGISDEMVEIKDKINDLSEDKKILMETLSEHKQSLAVVRASISNITKDITLLGGEDRMDGVSECPLCKSDVDHKHLTDWYDNEILSKELDLKKDTKKRNDIQGLIVDVEKDITDIMDDAISLAAHHKSLKNILVDHNEDVYRLNELKHNIKISQSHLDALKKQLTDNQTEMASLIEKLSDVSWKNDMNNTDISLYEKKVNDIRDLKDKIDRHNKLMDDTKRDLDNETSRLEDLQKVVADQDKQRDQKKLDISSKMDDINKFNNDITKSNKMLDHLNYVRISLKDENVKQFAISALLPFLNYRSNHYLSESGFPYIVDIDGWLDVTIKGMGTEDVGYESLSGGESKAMDMAIQLACNDIAELHAKTLLGISIYDEILDTSLDADGVMKMMSIIKVKQQDTNNCVLCITHREEIKDIDFDNNIMIRKENGFSTIQSENIMV